MKRSIALILCLLMLAALLPLHLHTAVAEGETSGQCGDDLYWSFDESTHTLTITGSGDMWDYADSTTPWSDLWVNMIELPDGITRIGNWVFRSNFELHSVDIPDSVISIGEFAFADCQYLESVSFGSGLVSIEKCAFDGCKALTALNLPDSVKNIGPAAFEVCKSLTSITIPDGVETIEAWTFNCCPNVTTVTIGNGVTSIGQYAFYNCTGLSEITIPAALKSVGENAFESCTALQTVFYAGTEADKANITFGDENDCLLNAEWRYGETGSNLEINETNFPDEAFRTWIIENLDVSGDAENGYYMTEEQAAAMTTIECGSGEVASLAGIANFPNLEELYCDPFTFSASGALSSVDLSANTKLKVVDLACNQLESIDVTMLPDLEDLSVGFTNVSTLDVTQNDKLTRLTINATGLTTIDISQNPLLDWLDLCDAPISKLDISGCPNMMAYYRAGELELDLPYLAGKHVYGEGNGDVLYNLAFSDGTTVKTVSVQAVAVCGETSVGEVAVSPEGIIFPGEQFTLTAPDAEGYTFVGWFDANTDEKLAATKVYTLSTQEEAVSFVAKYEEGTADDRYLEIDGTNFPDEAFRQWIIENLDVSGDDETGYYMTENQVLTVTDIRCSEQPIASLAGISNFPNLDVLEAHDCALESIDVSQNEKLFYLDLDNNQISAIDLSNNPALDTLFIDSNGLTALDLSKNTALTDLGCTDNQLTALDLSKNTALVYLDCSFNRLTELDVSSNTALTELYCYDNLLTSLDLSKNPALTSLGCAGNRLPVLDVSGNPALSYFAVNNQTLETQTATLDEGVYTFDMTALVPIESMAKVRMQDASNVLDRATGVVTFPGEVESFTYLYETGYDTLAVEVPLTFKETLSIKTQPKSVTAANGKTAKFTVKATGSDLTYQWYYSKDNGTKWTKYSGKTSASLSVKASTTTNGYLYRCVVKMGSEKVTSKNAKLTVSGVKPKIIVQPKAVTVKSGKTAKFSVVAAGSGLKYQWYYSKDNGTKWIKMSGKTTASLSVKGSATTNGYLYRCKITNTKGSVTSKSVKLTVSGVKPKIVVQPKAVSVKSGKTAKFTVVAAGTGLKYQWYYSKNAGKTWTKMSGKTAATLSVKGSKTNNGYLYRCVVKNTKDSVTSKNAKLTVK